MNLVGVTTPCSITYKLQNPSSRMDRATSFSQYRNRKNCKNSFQTLMFENIKIAGDFFGKTANR